MAVEGLDITCKTFTLRRVSKSEVMNTKQVNMLQESSSIDVRCTDVQLVHMLDGTCRSVKVLREFCFVLV